LCGYGASEVVDYQSLLEEAFDEDDEDIDDITVDVPAAIVAGAGLAVVLFCLLGCCGVLRENRIILSVYMPLMIAAFLCLAICTVVLFVRYQRPRLKAFFLITSSLIFQ